MSWFVRHFPLGAAQRPRIRAALAQWIVEAQAMHEEGGAQLYLGIVFWVEGVSGGCRCSGSQGGPN